MALTSRSGRPTALTVADPPRLMAYADRSGMLRSTVDAGLSVAQVWREQPSVRKVVSFMAEAVAALPWRAFQADADGGRVRLWDSPAEATIRRPARHESSATLIRSLALDSLTYGLALAVLMDGRVIRVPPPMVSVSLDALGCVTDVEVGSGKGHRVSVSELPLALMRTWSPDGVQSVAPIRTLRSLLDEISEAESWRRRQWTDKPRISAQVLRPLEAPRWSDESREAFRLSMADYRSGASNGIPLMEHGMRIEAVPDGVQPPDMSAASQMRTLTDVEVAGFFGVPPELIGARPANYGGYAALRRDLYTRVLGPLIGHLEDALGAEIVPALDPRDGVYARLDRSEAQDGTLLERLQALQSATGGPIMTRAEARERLDLPYLEGTEELVVPLNVVTGGQASPSDSGSQNLTDGSSREEDARAGEVSASSRRVLVSKADLGETALDRAVQAILSLADGSLSEEDAARLARRLSGPVSESVLAGANRVILRSGTGAATLRRADLENYIRAVAEGQAEHAVAVLRSAVEAGQEVGEAVTDARAAALAEAALRSAEGSGSHVGAQRTGAVRKRWVMGTSSNPRAEHAAMDGEEVALDEEFSNGMRFPRDWSGGDPGDIIYCSCSMEYVW